MKNLCLPLPVSCALLIFCNVAYGQTPTLDVGSGAPNETVRQRFINAYFRNTFYNLVSLPPIGEVKKLGTTGYVQEFNDANKTSGVKLAIVKANLNTAVADEGIDTFQMLAALYSYFNTVGVTTAGYPIIDTASCPSSGASCTYQLFDKKYALFAYTTALSTGQNFTVRDPFYSYWLAQSGITVFGAATSAETAVTSTGGSVATAQYFTQGALFNVTSGQFSGKLMAVRQPIYSVYTANGGITGTLGLPTSEVLLLANGNKRQTFEGGSVEYDPNNSATLRLPVNLISLLPSTSTIRLNLNDTYKLTAAVKAVNGDDLPDRVLNWTTTNGRVVSITQTGYSATLKAVSGGVATINATSEGKLSQQITVFVSAPCCQVGEGAPSSLISQSFLDSVSRNRLNLKLPSATPVRRSALGYLQEFLTDTGARLVLALPDRSAQAYVVTGPLLAAWETLGGSAGSLGYPSADATAGGRQNFEGGALAGAPVRLVAGSILSKWAVLGYETGAAGPPIAEANSFFTFAASGGARQVFRNGSLYLAQNGAAAGRVMFTTGLINTLYEAQGGAGGKFGAPTNDEFTSSGIRRQDFEGGYMQYAVGDQAAKAVENPRKPNVQAAPATVVAGSRVRLSIGGFSAGANLRITVTGQQDFLVRTDTGAYSWEVFVPSTATTSTIRIHVVDTSSATTVADGLYNIKAVADAKLILQKVSGDAQSGLPGSILASPLRVVLRDDSGNPLSGVPVAFRASPGASINPAMVNTGVDGSASANLRLPATGGTAQATAEALRQIVTFSALALPSTITGLTRQTTTGDPMYASAAMLMKFYQDRGELTTTNGLFSASLIENYLKGFCALDNQGVDLCDGQVAVDASTSVPNLWRLANLVSGNLEISAFPVNLNSIRDQLSQGNPLLISLALNSGEYRHAVVATGLASDGGVTILDPSAAFSRTNLNDYITGFSAAGVNYKATLAGALRLLPRTPTAPGFLVITSAAVEIASPGGICGANFDIPAASGTLHFRYCDGAQSLYQLDITAAATYKGYVVDLGVPTSRTELNGNKAGAFRIARPATQWEPSPLEASFKTESVLSAASFTTEIAPGGLVSIFGVGLARAGGNTTVTVSGVDAPVLVATPFQVNAQMPLELPAGSHTLQLRSPFGLGESQISLLDSAPAIFKLNGNQGAIVNQDGSINSSSTPARRGQAIVIYCTGLGGVVASGNLRVTARPVTVILSGTAINPFFAGLTPGFVGLYQVNAILPISMPPGLDLQLSLRQGGTVSLPVAVSLQ